MKRRRHTVTSLAFFSRLKWLDGTPLLNHLEEYRREIFCKALDSFDERGRPLYNMVLAGRGKKNAKSLDLILAGLFVLVIRRSVQGSDGFVLANDADQALDDLSLAKKLIAANPDLANEIEPLAIELRLRDGSASLKILPAKDTVGTHGKSAAFVGFDEIQGYKDWSLIEALQRYAARLDVLRIGYVPRLVVRHDGCAAAWSRGVQRVQQGQALVVLLVQWRFCAPIRPSLICRRCSVPIRQCRAGRTVKRIWNKSARGCRPAALSPFASESPRQSRRRSISIRARFLPAW